MKPFQFKFARSTSLLATLSVLGLGAIGCADANHEESQAAALSASGWTWCAVQGELCAFEGTHQVQFGAGPQFVTRTFSGGVHCNSADFGATFGQGNACYVLLGEESVRVHDHGSTSATTTVTEDAGHTHEALADAGVATDDAAVHSHDVLTTSTTGVTAAPMAGPYINKAAIPAGSPGVGVLEVRPTTEKPLANNDVGAFRTVCGMSHMNNDDPIVFPGQVGKAHLHTFFGNTGANANSTAESLRNSGNSTCRGGIANRSAYWVPAVIAKDGTPLKPRSANTYYKTGYNGIAPKDIKVFPQGLRMIAGDAKMAAPGQEHAFWSCEVYNGHPNAIPDCGAGQAVIMQVIFPQCWNGKDLDASDHKSHMAYPVKGVCPSTHPVAIPEISFNIWYDVPAGTRSSEWHLSSDMYDQSKPGGYSAHGDWFEGWDRDIAEAFVKNCDNTQSDCHSHLLGDGREIYSSVEGL